MEKLIRGFHAFKKDYFSSQRELFERLAKRQEPEALFITCADSRINPNLITQTEPGELFIIRNAGNIVPPYGEVNGGEVATVEYAVSALGVKDIIVCGHTHCGAMNYLLHPEEQGDLPAMSAWLQQAESTRQIIQESYRDCCGESLLLATIKENVLVQLDNLRTHPAVKERLALGDLHLHGWVFHIETGEVYAFDPESERFNPLVEAPRTQVSSTR